MEIMENLLSTIEPFASFIKDVGIIAGVTIIISFLIKLYRKQIDILKTEMDILKRTQYDQFVVQLEAQKDIYEWEKSQLETEIENLKESNTNKTVKIEKLEEKVLVIRGNLLKLEYNKNSANQAIKLEALRKLKIIMKKNNNQKNWIDESIFREGTYGCNFYSTEQSIMEKEGWIEIANNQIRITEKGIKMIADS